MFALTNLYLEGHESSAESISSRVILAFWWMFVVIVVTLYSGNLVAFLTFPIIEPGVGSIDELIAMDNAAADVTWGLLNGRYTPQANKGSDTI